MSIKLMNAVWENTEPKGLERLCLLAMADQANDQGVCWPSYDTIAKRVACSRRYAIELISKLEKDGYLITQERFERGMNTSNIYRVVVNPSSLPGVNPSSLGSEPQFTRVVNPSSPKPPINHQLTVVVVDDAAPRKNIYQLYEQSLGQLITAGIKDHLKAAEEKYPPEWIAEAFEVAVMNNGRSWAYVLAILKKWEAHGFKADTRQKQQPRAQAKRDIFAELEAA